MRTSRLRALIMLLVPLASLPSVAAAQEQQVRHLGAESIDYVWQFQGVTWATMPPAKHPIAEVIAAAKQGDIVAKRTLAIACRDGRGQPEDLKRAVELMQEAAAAKDSLAMLCMFHMHLAGVGVPKDPERALKIAGELVAVDPAAGKYALGICHWTGTGTRRDIVKALTFCKESADAGFPRAIAWRGERAAKGDGVDKNPTQAFACYKLAANLGLVEAMTTVSIMYREGDGVAKDMAAAEAYLRIALAREDPRGQYLQAQSLFAAKDEVGGMKFLRLAALSDFDAMTNLAMRLLDAKGSEKDATEGLRLLGRAAEMEHPAAQTILGIAYMEGSYGYKIDLDRAKKIFEGIDERTKDPYDPSPAVARRSLAIMYLDGKGVAVDYKKASKLLMAARYHDRMAEVLRGIMAQNGWGESGGRPNVKEAKYIYDRVSDVLKDYRRAPDPAADALAKRLLIQLEGENQPADPNGDPDAGLNWLVSLGQSHSSGLGRSGGTGSNPSANAQADAARAVSRFQQQTAAYLGAVGAR